MVAQLRRSIFVDVAYLAEREQERCSSLDGPRCLRFTTGGSNRAGRGELDGPGVLPERLLRDLGAQSGDLDFVTPLYNDLEAIRRQLLANSEVAASAGPEEQALADSGSAEAALTAARPGAEHGVLHLGGLQPDRRVPLSFSRGLPRGVVATWDGRWIARSCLASERDATTSLPTAGWPLALPEPPAAVAAVADRKLPVAPPSAQVLGSVGAARPAAALGLSAVAELAGSVGYLRFSRPVVVRSLFARWAPEVGAPPAVVAGRLGLQCAWATHMDPKRLKHEWMDISGGSLRLVDELAFLSAPGLELAALWAVGHEGGAFEDGSAEHTVMLLEPMANTSLSVDRGQPPHFRVQARTIFPAAAPFLVSLQEAVDRNLQLHLEPSAWGAPHSHGVAANYPALLSTESGSPERWTPAAVANQQMLEHELLMPLLGGQPSAAERLAAAMHRLSPDLPRDLQRELEREREAIVDALQGWAVNQGNHSKPSALPANGSESAVQSYMRAKRSQAKLDLLTAAFLHLRPQMVAVDTQQQLWQQQHLRGQRQA